jgi:saccharopepsin
VPALERVVGCHSDAWRGYSGRRRVLSIQGDEFTRPSERCMPPIDPSGSVGFALIGTTLLHRYYSVFDFGGDKVEEYQPRIGFGRLKKEYDYLHQ